MPRARAAVIRRQPTSEVGKARRAPADTRRIADIVPNTVRSLLGLVEDRGHAPERLCKGLGFTGRDLHDRDLLLSYQQVRALILRARRLLEEPAMGLAAGMRQRPVSWGLTGLAMLTCETFGEAIAYGLGHQHEAGAMMQHLFAQQGPEASIELVPHVFDLEIEPYLIEEAFAGALNVSRCMLGPDIRPRAVELAFARSAPLQIYTRFFRCPVRFGAGRNRMTLEAKWLAARLPGYDRTTGGLLRQQLETLIQRPPSRNELVESIALRLRSDAERAPRQPELARQANCSERTLRRRLGAQQVGYRALRDAARYERARDLLRNSQMTVAEVAQAVGYADARAFRRAFQRWSGRSPGQARESH
ncbi:AraC family transcriptional regulator [Xanthomonas citri]|uniref:AraC family transcriptional regulator n=2 Tax=Xanthomonas citri TaxID=346 RepID=UPI0009C36D10|nr:AraC family transcriptional regulator [Xanthomonas citri]AMV08511.1 AraC family transcriptional regulator [Xanthomonas citri pv. aurantifolii]ARE56907.1 AraC family transcriptional regulator [Xanthomonas citri pv. aurantifolii]